jgi:5-(carboxyamino)imidazole ribonucleotide synthase
MTNGHQDNDRPGPDGDVARTVVADRPPDRPPDRQIGIIGGGQLAQMMAPAAAKLGLELWVQTPQADDPAVATAAHAILAPVADAQATAQLAQHCDVITFENEFINLSALQQLPGVCFRPSLAALEPLLDKYDQRCFLRDHGLPTPEFCSPAPAQPPSFPAVLKTRRLGYDGQGTFIVADQAAYNTVLMRYGAVALLWEAFVPFTKELAVMGARSVTGQIVLYPVVETQQQQQVCRWVIAPADLPTATQDLIESVARTLLERLDVVGILGIELFWSANGKILVNEIAPRTHNSGHYTLDACVTSQFEQQLRAVSGDALGSPALTCAGALMVNLLGFESARSDYAAQQQQLAALATADCQVSVHWYGKPESRPGRKLGHVTFCLASPDHLRVRALDLVTQVAAIWPGPQ